MHGKTAFHTSNRAAIKMPNGWPHARQQRPQILPPSILHSCKCDDNRGGKEVDEFDPCMTYMSFPYTHKHASFGHMGTSTLHTQDEVGGMSKLSPAVSDNNHMTTLLLLLETES